MFYVERLGRTKAFDQLPDAKAHAAETAKKHPGEVVTVLAPMFTYHLEPATVTETMLDENGRPLTDEGGAGEA